MELHVEVGASNSMLKRPLLLAADARICGEDCIFRHYNVVIHTVRRSKNLSQANVVRFLDQSSSSPDLSRMSRDVYENGAQFSKLCLPPGVAFQTRPWANMIATS